MFVLALLILWPLAELFVAINVADAIGVGWMIVLLLAGWPIGMWAMRSQGRAVWRRLQTAVADGRPPAREVLDGALVLAGGALLIIPGFITDLLGICLLLPPTRALTRWGVVRNFRSRAMVRAVQFTSRGQRYDVDSTAHDVDQPQLRP
jgi:UPF0716 protein FxsA